MLLEYYDIDLMLPPSENLLKCHEKVLSLQPMIPHLPFDVSTTHWGCSEGLGAFRFFYKNSSWY